MMPNLITLRVEHRTGREFIYRGVFVMHRNNSLNVMTLDYLDPADLADCKPEHVVSFPHAAIDWWTERPYEGPPYISLPNVKDTDDAEDH